MSEHGLQAPRPADVSRFALPFSLLCVAAGIVLRLSYPEDIEFKPDERWTFDQVQTALKGGPWLSHGMPMSIGGLNAGMSLWVFIGLGWLTGAETPPELARAVQALNCAALIALVLFAWRWVGEQDREIWFWAAGLWAINPVAVILERKIWPPSVLPLLTVAMIAAWWHRPTASGSFLFALVATVMAQIHPSAAFLAAAMAIWSLAADRRSLRWGWLLAGAALGALPALPWLLEWQIGSGGGWRWPILSYWFRWFLQPFGFGAEYTLGFAHFIDYLRGPVIAGVPTYVVALLHASLALLALAIYWRAARPPWTGPGLSVRHVLLGGDATGLLLRATLIGYGILLTALTLGGAGSHRHYLIVIAPIMALWVVRLAANGDGGSLRRHGRMALAGLCVAGGLVSATLLRYIHSTQVIVGEYGATWAAQQAGRAPPAQSLVVPPRR